MKKIGEEKTDQQILEIEETEPDHKGRKESIHIFLKRSILKPEKTKQYGLGDQVITIGRLDSKITSKGNQEIKIIRGYGIENFEETKTHNITKEEINILEEASKTQDLVKWWLEQGLYKPIEGHETIKEAIIVALIGTKTTIVNGKTNRGIIHVYMGGDPSSAKSALLKLTEKYALRAKYVTGAGSTSVGLTGAVVRDETLGTWTVEAGAMPLMHKAISLVDELDKLGEGEENNLHEPLEQMTVSINKAGVSITMPSETTFIGAGNPKGGNIDPYTDIFSQLGFKSTTASRMDLIFVIRDQPDTEKDSNIATKIFDSWEEKQEKNIEETISLFKKYQKHAKKIEPKISSESRQEIVEWYVDIRDKMKKAETKMQVTARALDALIRLTLSHARANLRKTSNKQDVEWAKKTYFESLKSIAIDIITGDVDMMKLETGFGREEKKVIDLIYDIIKSEETIEHDELKRRLNKDIGERELEKMLENLKKRGDIFEPRNGRYKANK